MSDSPEIPSPTTWDAMWALFHDALERPVEDRYRFLQDACGDTPELLTSIVKLLDAHESGDGDLLSDIPAVLHEGADSAVDMDPKRGEKVGAYLLEKVIGEGGMGVVYLAQQSKPVKREVALKLLRLGLATRDVMARFEAERQVLAMMNHSNIAKVFDAGATENGRPYFVMEYVAGVPVTQYCDEHCLDIAERLKIFVNVCEGVQHAHQKGIIHRDIKPSNILVAAENNVAVPKIIDFGIAKATEQHLGEQTLHTQLGVMIGTPGYMSPEQAGVTDLDVDTRADVYSLGALLYELLVGVVPFESMTSRRGPLDIQRAIRDEEPKRPGLRFSGMPEDELDKLCRARRTSVSSLRRLLDGDIFWIADKALQKNREQRYASVADLSSDIHRYLDGLPVQARAPTRWYRARKFTRRHKAGVAVTAAMSIITVVFAVFMTLQTLRLQKALDETTLERNRAEQVSDFMVQLFESANPGQSAETTVSVKDMLDTGSAQLRNELQDQPELRARLLATVSETYRVLGGIDNAGEAIALLEQALADLESVPDTGAGDIAAVLNSIGSVHHDLGDYETAESFYIRAVEMFRQGPGEVSERLADTLANLSVLYTDRGSLAQAADLARESLDIQLQISGSKDVAVARTTQRLAYILHRQGDNEQALPMMTSSVALLRELNGDSHPSIATALNYLATVQRASGDAVGAQQSYGEAVDIYRRSHGDDHPYLANTYSNLALAYSDDGKFREATDALAEALRIGVANFGEENPSVNSFRINLATTLQSMGQFEKAEPLFRAGLARDRQDLDPQSPFLLATIDRLGGLLGSLGRYQEADILLQEALDLRLENLGPQHTDTGAALRNLAANLLSQGRLDLAGDLARRAIDIQRDQDVGNPARLASEISLLGQVMAQKNELTQARALYEEALGILDESEDEPSLAVARIRLLIGEMGEDTNATLAAENTYKDLVPVFDEFLYEGHPDIARLQIALGRMRCRNSGGAEGIEQVQSARPLLEQSFGADNWQLVDIDIAIGECLAQQGAFAEAESRLIASFELLQTIRGASHPVTVRLRDRINDFYVAWGRPAEGSN